MNLKCIIIGKKVGQYGIAISTIHDKVLRLIYRGLVIARQIVWMIIAQSIALDDSARDPRKLRAGTR